MNVCGYCHKPLPAGNVSEWWCGINCQQAWHVDRVGPLNVYDVTSRPNYYAYQGDWSLDAWDAHTKAAMRTHKPHIVLKTQPEVSHPSYSVGGEVPQ